ncbi:MAG: glycosyltransferase family 1 protein [Myxococcales bacterium]|nr:glycosyltransferase family 1 protein [Myxococcales bacterium]
MRLFVCGAYHYYGLPTAVEPQYYYLVKVPQALGHEVRFFDFHAAPRRGQPAMREAFLAALRDFPCDAVFIATHRDEFDRDTLTAAARLAPTFAWNSDDEWRWTDYSAPRADWYTFMVTNSPDVYETQRDAVPNLLHAQWACTGFWNGLAVAKDVDFSFVGQVYGERARQIRQLRRGAGLIAFGLGSGNPAPLPDGGFRPPSPFRRAISEWSPSLAYRLFGGFDTLDFAQVNGLWNRSRVSFTPLDSSRGGARQIKSRVFDMGLSGTLMLAHRAPRLDDYYTPDKEYVPFDTLEECLDKARYFLEHEAERARIAAAYAARTQAEHLWSHRINAVLRAAGLSRG